jgi:succinylglutamate desuccinylase
MTTPELFGYPIEIEFPDIRPYQTGNTGVDHVHRFESGQSGPDVMVNALTHGNEVSGAITVMTLLDSGIRPRRGSLTLSFANAQAYARFDPAQPDASRYVDEDFNRVWADAKLDGGAGTCELRRARMLRPFVDRADFLLDLHSMHEKSAPLMLTGPLAKGVALARQIGTPAHIVRDAGHLQGRRMRDYAAFGDAASPKNALLLEAGQHWEAKAVQAALDVTMRFLLATKCLDASDIEPSWLQPVRKPQQVIDVTEAVVAQSMDFRFTENYSGLEVIPEAGTVVAYDDGHPVRTPYDDCVLVMPSLRQLRPGVTVVRFGQEERPSPRAA